MMRRNDEEEERSHWKGEWKEGVSGFQFEASSSVIRAGGRERREEISQLSTFLSSLSLLKSTTPAVIFFPRISALR